MLIERTAKDFVYDVASESPTPGGGSVAALVGSLGGALTNMVGNLTIDKKIYADVPEEKKAKMESNFKELEALVDELLDLVDEDSTAFDDVMQAFKLPKDTDENKKIRSEAIQSGYKKALEVPLRCGERCYVGVGTLLAYAGLEGALFNVTINLKSIKDQDYKNEMEKRVEKLLADGKSLRDSLLEVVYGRLKA
jgi:formiminotetrahydrofolate cyclodeaminase